MREFPLDGRSCRTPAEHRAAIAAADDRRRSRLSWPTGERLRNDPVRLALLVEWRDLMDPPRPAVAIDPADESMRRPTLRHDVPDEDDLLAAAGRGSYVTTRRYRRGVWSDPLRVEARYGVKGTTACLGHLEFRGGELVRWGTYRRGAPMKPYEHSAPAVPRGIRHGSIWRKAVPGTADGMAYVTNGVAMAEIPDHEADPARGADAKAAREAVGPRHAEVIDLAVSSATAREIGEAFGYSGKYAERRGARLVDDALDVFGEYLRQSQIHADNDNENILAAAA